MQKIRGDKVLFAMVILLMIFGLVMIASIGVSKSLQLTAPANIALPNCTDSQVDCYLLLKNHAIRLVVGALCLFLAMKIPMRFWKKISPFLFGATIIFLFLLLVLGSKYTTFAKSWIVLFNTSFQPIEFAKLGLIFYLANWMEKKQNQIGDFQFGFLPFCILTGVIILPIVLQPDLGGTIVVGIIAVVMYFSAGARMRHIALIGLIALLAGIVFISSGGRYNDRYQAYLNLDKVSCNNNKYCWQSRQANIAVGSGGFWGKGLTQGVQKSYWLPQASDDFIFAASAEELGFVRISLLVIVYTVIAYRGFRIAASASNKFTQFSAIGLATWITAQAFVNISVNLAIMPVTGITLPFVSYGGSSLLSVMIAAGILLHISQNHSDYAPSLKRRGNRRTYHPQYRLGR